MKRIFLFILLIVVLAILGLYISGNQHVLVAVQKTYLVGQTGPSIDDFGQFTHRRVAAENMQPWPTHIQHSSIPAKDRQWLDSMGTATFLVIQRDSILFESYFDDYKPDYTPNIFSAAKSLVSIAIGVLVGDGKINLDDAASQYIPELAEKGYDGITIRHLLQMASGLGFDENYKNPFGYQAKVYYGQHLRENTLAFDAEHEPGEEWFYSGGNTVILSLIVEKVSGEKLANFFAKRVWQPIGAEMDAWWTIDSKGGIERASCCFYAITRDLARIGQLYLNGGNWNGQEIVPEWYVEESTTPVMTPDSKGEPVLHYGFQWWLGKDFYQAQGMLGQYIIVVPDEDLIIVRTGHHRSEERFNHLPADAYRYIEIAKGLLL